MACHTDLNTLAMERLSAIVLMSTEQEKENQALRVKVQQLELKVKVQQLDSDRAKLENELQDAQSRENPVSDSLHPNPRLSNLIAANSEQEPIPQRRQQKRWFPKKFIPYPAPMGDIKICLQKHPGFLRDRGSMTWTLPEEDAAIKYILAGDTDEPNLTILQYSLGKMRMQDWTANNKDHLLQFEIFGTTRDEKDQGVLGFATNFNQFNLRVTKRARRTACGFSRNFTTAKRSVWKRSRVFNGEIFEILGLMEMQ